MAWAKAPFPDFDSPPNHWHSITALTLIPAKVIASVYQGGLFSSDFLTESIIRLPDYSDISDARVDEIAASRNTVHFVW